MKAIVLTFFVSELLCSDLDRLKKLSQRGFVFDLIRMMSKSSIYKRWDSYFQVFLAIFRAENKESTPVRRLCGLFAQNKTTYWV